MNLANQMSLIKHNISDVVLDNFVIIFDRHPSRAAPLQNNSNTAKTSPNCLILQNLPSNRSNKLYNPQLNVLILITSFTQNVKNTLTDYLQTAKNYELQIKGYFLYIAQRLQN